MLLDSLNLSNNTLSGELPDCWTYIHDLVVLNLANNNFYGKIPHSMGSLSSIEEFVFQNSLVLLKMIDLSSNKLRGEINNLSGLISSKIGLLKNLESLDLSRNQLCGKIPMSISNELKSNYSMLLHFLGNSELSGSPLPNKCLEYLQSIYVNTWDHKNNNIQTYDNDRFITKGFYIVATLRFIEGFWNVCFISVLNIRFIMKLLTSNAQMKLT
ncbi:hypothetical protein I3842_Q067400 [Carya illinoinensis]|uniref:Uncharacterized protein n=1 Tax=Carya illinoinensis TaxID=32201 RepID=A0A922A3I9_CARIL|nr:hypothetical protein I3842_Q067400 [Carya illinoinensis]